VYSKLGVPIKTTISANVLEEALNGTVTVRPLPVGTSVSGKVLVMFMSGISYNHTLSFLLTCFELNCRWTNNVPTSLA
jgi:hypothetical protein